MPIFYQVEIDLPHFHAAERAYLKLEVARDWFASVEEVEYTFVEIQNGHEHVRARQVCVCHRVGVALAALAVTHQM